MSVILTLNTGNIVSIGEIDVVEIVIDVSNTNIEHR